MAIFRKRGKWWIGYSAEGRRIRECVGPSRRAAERALASRKGEIVQGRFKLAERTRSPRFEAVADEYLAWARGQLRSWRRQEGALAHLRAFFAGRTLRDITPWLVERYTQERLKARVRRRRVAAAPASPGARPASGTLDDGQPIRPPTINRELACLKRLFSLAIEWGKAQTNPVGGVKFFREDGRRERVLAVEEIGALLAACGVLLGGLVLMALHAGMRRGEVLGLRWDALDLERGVATLARTKSGKPRKVPLNAEVVAMLRARPRPGPYVFGGAKPLGWRKRAWRTACRRAGLVGIRFHDLRHTWATYAVLATGDLRSVQEIGGWSSLAMVERYSHPTDDARRRVAEDVGRALAAGSGHQSGTTATPQVVVPLKRRVLTP